MIMLIVGIVLAILCTASWVTARAYGHIPARELKRRVRQGDELAAVLYKVAAYGLSVQIVLYVFAALCLYAAYLLLVQSVGAWLALPTLGVLLLAGAGVIYANGGPRRISFALAAKVSKPLAWLIERTQPVLGLVERAVRRVFPLHLHSSVYERADLIHLLQQQAKQPDNRIAGEELMMAENALTFGDKTVADVLSPKRLVTAVKAGDAIGPLLMDELHKAGHSRFPVYEGQKNNIIGILYLHDLVTAKQSGVVRDIMRSKVVYVHEKFTLSQTLQAFLKTKQHLFIVVNEFEEYVGIITIEGVLEQIVGVTIPDDFDQYEDLRAVATVKQVPKMAAEQHQIAATKPLTNTSPEKSLD